MCPCDAACKTVRLVEIFIDLSRRKSVILGEETAKQHLPRAELIGFVSLASLRKNKKVCQRVPLSHRRPSHVSYVSHLFRHSKPKRAQRIQHPKQSKVNLQQQVSVANEQQTCFPQNSSFVIQPSTASEANMRSSTKC